ncbi:heparanase-like [Clytia hemisphaerica]|uniref:heparanase-like n=1 Tax=Clytia hemisphaerica TaxID=252671 RepID=UPI0034D46FB6
MDWFIIFWIMGISKVFWIIAMSILFTPISSTEYHGLHIEQKPIHEVSSKFLSVCIGSGTLTHYFRHLDFNSKAFRTLTKGLNSLQKEPSMFLRFGGSEADNLVFNDTSKLDKVPVFLGDPRDDYNIYPFNFTTFEKLYNFTSSMSWRLIFDLNSLIRNKTDGSYDPRNAVKFIEALSKQGYSIDYELGNEPDLYPTHRNTTIPPEQLAADFAVFKEIIIHMTHGKSKLFGPDMATLGRYGYFHKFLSNIKQGSLDAITYHHYYSASTNVTVKDFVSIEYLDKFLAYTQEAADIVKESVTTFQSPPVFIGETSSTYGGGIPEIGQSFAASFLWLDKLGLAAQRGIQSVMRQALKGGSYSLMDKDYIPCIDYWVTVLHKQLVGTKVLKLTGFLEPGRSLRAYAHCVNVNNQRGYVANETIVLFVLNMSPSEDAKVVLTNLPLTNSVEADQFLLTSANGELGSTQVKMNGQILEMLPGLPELIAKKVKSPFILPPLSYGFYVINNSGVNCS